MDSYLSSSLTCFLCSGHFKDPRFLPCYHTFCFACLQSICDQIASISHLSSTSKKLKLSCPLCKVQFNMPSNGADGFPVDLKTLSLKDKIVQEIADNITRRMSNSKENLPSSSYGYSSMSADCLKNNDANAKFSRFQQPDLINRENYDKGSDIKIDTSSKQTGSSSVYRDFGKFAKYFNTSDDNGNADVNYKPTIRPDHTRLGYETSFRFRNKRMSNGEKDNNEDKNMRRRTWYGSTLHSRRTQSLNRSLDGCDDININIKSSDNLFKIQEDKEHTYSPNDNTQHISTFNKTMPSYCKDTIFETTTNSDDAMKQGANMTDYSGSSKISDKGFNLPNDYTKRDNPTYRHSNPNIPPRPTLFTHRENITTDSFKRKNSKEKKDPSSPECKMSFRTRKHSPNVKGKKLTSPSSPRKKFGDSSSPNQSKLENQHKKCDEQPIKKEKSEKQYVPNSNDIREEKGHRNSRNVRDGPKVNIQPGHGSKAARDQLSFDFESQTNNQTNIRMSRFQQQQQEQQKQNVHLSNLSGHKQQRKPRCQSVDPRYSLNKNDFETNQEFKEHLLGMTMKKKNYEDIMNDFRNDRVRLDSTGSFENDDRHAAVDNDGDENESHMEKNIDPKDKEKNYQSGKKKGLPTEKKEPEAHEPLIDDHLITSFRMKYSSALEIKKFPTQTLYPDLSDGVTKCWTYQKNDFGVPTSAIFMKSNSLAVADYGQSCLEFLDHGGHIEHVVTGIKPFGMCAYNDNSNLIVGDRKTKSLRIFDEFGTDISQIDNLGSLEWLSGLAIKNDGGLVMSDRGRCKIIISTIGGEIIKEFGSYGSSPKQLCMADFLIVDKRNRIIVCDSGNHCLKIFDMQGTSLLTVGSRGNMDGLLEWPKGVAVDDNENILVADTMNKRISMFSPDGLFIKHLISSIPDPYNLTWFNKQLAVLHYNLKGLSQYDVYSY